MEKGTNYTILVNALNSDGEILKSATRTIKTKYFTEITSEKTEDTFKFTIYGLDEKADINLCEFWNQDMGDERVEKEVVMDENRNIYFEFKKSDLEESSGYYYVRFQLKKGNYEYEICDVISVNVVFGMEYKEKDLGYDNYKLNSSGKYQIVVVDLAGNITEKTCTLKM